MPSRSGAPGACIIGSRAPGAGWRALLLACCGLWVGLWANLATAQPASLPEAGASERWDYELGAGLRRADLGLTLGGYVTAEAQTQQGQPSQLRLAHASVFLWWEPNERLKVFAEIDQENVVARQRQPGGPNGRSATRQASLERLNATWAFSDALALRAGKFLTPVGRWNLLHAGPLVWTSNRPLITQSVYPNNLTGVEAAGTLALGEQRLGYSVYVSNGGEWAPDPRQDLFSQVRGLRAVLPLGPQWEFGASYARYEQQGSRGDPRRLEGLDARWARSGFELSAEWLRTTSLRKAALPPGRASGLHNTTLAEVPSLPVLAPGTSPPGGFGGQRTPVLGLPTSGAYVQGVAPLAERWFAVARLERLRDITSPQSLRQTTLGVVWKPSPATSIKLEQQRSQGRSDLAINGWTASVSVLF